MGGWVDEIRPRRIRPSHGYPLLLYYMRAALCRSSIPGIKDNLMQSLIVSTILPSLCTVHPLTPPGRATLRTVLAHNIAKIESPATSTPKGRGWVYVCLLPGKHTKAPALAPGSNPRGVARTDFLAHHPRPGVTCHRHPSLLPQGHQPLMGNHT